MHFERILNPIRVYHVNFSVTVNLEIMKKEYLLLFFLSSALDIFSQQIIWTDTIGYSTGIGISNLALDQEQNVYVAGGFGGNCCGPYGIFYNKYDSNGNILIQDTISCPYNTNIATAGAASDSQNNLYSVFRNFANFKMGNIVYPPQTYLVKRNSADQILWAVPQNFEYPYHIATDLSNNVYVAYNDVKKYDSSGNLVYSANSSGHIAVDSSMNLYIMSLSLRKHNPNGNLLWTYPNIAGDSQFTVDASGNSYVHESNGPNGSILRKINSQGQLLWSLPVWMTSDGGICCYSDHIYIAGISGDYQTGVFIEIRKIDINGNLTWTYQIPVGTTWTAHAPVDILACSTGIYLVTIKTQNVYALLLKIEEPDIPTALYTNRKKQSIQIAPNPSNSTFTLTYKSGKPESITIKLSDALGKIISTKSMKNFNGEINEIIDLTGFPKGVYILELSSNEMKETRKLVIE
jgi:hypothetical protein